MPAIILQTLIDAAPEVCFDLSLNIDLHMQSMEQTNEKAVGGRTSGQIKLGETVKWKARHFGLYFTMTSLITDLIRPTRFTDEMTKGPFQHLRHQHIFEKTPAGTMMTDLFEFQSPFWILGNIADRLFLKRYLRNLLTKRNELIKNTAERSKNTPL
jgi:ligand-binding SRPBCC domain-containing protein